MRSASGSAESAAESTGSISAIPAKAAAWLAAFVLGMVVGLVGFVGLVGLAPTAEAQPRRGGAPGPVERRDEDKTTGKLERREQIKKKIRALRAYQLTEDLALDEQTAGKLFPLLARYDDETDKLLEKQVDIRRRFNRVDSIADSPQDAKAVERLLDEAVANQRALWDLGDRRIAELRKILTSVQAAKLFVVLPDFERKIQRQLRKAIVKRHTAGSVDDTDDDQESDEIAPAPSRPRRRHEVPPAPTSSPSNAPGNTQPCNPNAEPCR